MNATSTTEISRRGETKLADDVLAVWDYETGEVSVFVVVSGITGARIGTARTDRTGTLSERTGRRVTARDWAHISSDIYWRFRRNAELAP